MYQELQRTQIANDVTRAWQASGQPADAAAYAAASDRRTPWPLSYLESVTSYQKFDSANRCVLTNSPAKFHPDPIKNGVSLSFFEERSLNNKNNNNRMSRMILDKFLIQKFRT